MAEADVSVYLSNCIGTPMTIAEALLLVPTTTVGVGGSSSFSYDFNLEYVNNYYSMEER